MSVVGFAEAAVGLVGAELVSGSEAATREAISGVLSKFLSIFDCNGVTKIFYSSLKMALFIDLDN